ncbi:MAG: type III PLP-dependent enzyme [Shimia sp.]
MRHAHDFPATPAAWIAAHPPDTPVHLHWPARLAATVRRFREGFDGQVTFAVKANPAAHVLETLVGAGLEGFDVASPDEIATTARLFPGLPRHYNNPVRSRAEIAAGLAAGIDSWSVDRATELETLKGQGPAGTEVAVRIALPVTGAAYDFGAKFGADPASATTLLRAVADQGWSPAMTFHVGTQCGDPGAWRAYIEACGQVARAAGVDLGRLNVGGGFPSARSGDVALEPIFDAIHAAARDVPGRPALVCEPGRALVADAFALAVPVKAVAPGAVVLTDGLYGGLSELPIMGAPRFEVIGADGAPRTGATSHRVVWGPTCDSLDRLRDPLPLPDDLEEGDAIVFHAMGAYVEGVDTRFNGYGARALVTLAG